MSYGVSYAAAVSTPNGNMRQPQIQARACSDPDMRSSYESQTRDETKTKPRRPGAGMRAKSSFRGWSKKGKEPMGHERGSVQEVKHTQESQIAQTSREEHRPNTAKAEDHVYVLTLKLERSLSQPMNQMREQYFPRRLNHTPAHLTLFHALPHSQLETLENSLAALVLDYRPFQVTTGGPFRMRKGVGVNVDSGYQRVKDMHAQLKSHWLSFLSEQDAGGFRPHWTVMNKVDDDEKVDSAFRAVREQLAANTCEGQAIGLELWKYNRGRWEWANEYTFSHAVKQLNTTQPARCSNDDGGQIPSRTSPAGAQASDRSVQRPGLKRGSSVAEAWRSLSFRQKG